MSAVGRLEESMTSLRQWLARVEAQLSRNLVYQRPDFSEIQRCLQENQQLQNDVERHTSGVTSGKLDLVLQHLTARF